MEEVKQILAPASNGMLIAVIILLLMFIILLATIILNRFTKDFSEQKEIVKGLVEIANGHEFRINFLEDGHKEQQHELRLLRGEASVKQARK